MTKIKDNRTLAVHIDCANMVHGMAADGWTYRDAMTAWGIDHLRAIGYRIEPHPMYLVARAAESVS